MNLLSALAAAAFLTLVPCLLTWALPPLGWLFGLLVPALALVVFVVGFVARIVGWARVPAPFAIATTCGQQESLDFIAPDRLECPPTRIHVLGRMALEVLLFRSLLRNTRLEQRPGGRLTYHSNEWLWLFGLLFHYSLLVIALRHLRLLVHPTPGFVRLLDGIDGFLQVGMPVLYVTDITLLAAVTFLVGRRILSPHLRYISLAADYFPLFLVLGIAATGMAMRYWIGVDVASVKELMLGLFRLEPRLPAGLHPLLFSHLLLVSALVAYLPWSKLMHMGGVFMSPTRNLRAASRAFRHVNPWNPRVEVHTYAEWEDEFRDRLVAASLPVERASSGEPASGGRGPGAEQ